MINIGHTHHYAIGYRHRLRGRSHFHFADLPNPPPLLLRSCTPPHRPWGARRPSAALAAPIISLTSPHRGYARHRSCERVGRRCHLRRQQCAPARRHLD